MTRRIGVALREARCVDNLSLRELSRHLGCSHAFLLGVEVGRRIPPDPAGPLGRRMAAFLGDRVDPAAYRCERLWWEAHAMRRVLAEAIWLHSRRCDTAHLSELVATETIDLTSPGAQVDIVLATVDRLVWDCATLSADLHDGCTVVIPLAVEDGTQTWEGTVGDAAGP